MGTTADKLNKILETKAAIKSAIISKGVEVADGTKFADYPSKIAAISGGGSSEADTYYEDLFNQRTSDGMNMSYLFYNSSSSEFDVSRIDTSKTISMSGMFYNCFNLTSLDVSNFDTSKVIYMDSMFYYCSNLTSLDLSNFNTSNVTSMSGMFYDCFNLTSLDLSNFNTSKVTYMSSMFSSCSNLTSLDLSNFNTSNVTSMSNMFYHCSNLTSLDLSNFDTSKVTSMSYMFYHCSNLTSLDLSNFDTSKVTSMSSMFYNCSNLQELRLDNCSNDTVSDIINSSDFPTGTIDGVTRTIYCTERAASGLTAPSGWVFSFVESPYYIEYTVDTSSTYALNGGSSSYKYGLPRIYSTSSSYTYDGYEDIEITLLDGTTTTDVTTTCNNVAKVKIWYPANTKAVKFYGSSSYNPVIKTVDYCDTSNFTDMSYMFYYCRALTSINLSDWNISNVTNLKYTFCYCSKLTSLDVSNWDTSNVTSMHGTFWYCPKLTSINLSSWNTSKATTMYQMFAYCYDLAVLDVSNFDASNLSNTDQMFLSCSDLHTIRLDNCNNNFISYIINSTSFPTDTISGVTRTIYCTEDAASGLTAPTNWVFSFIDGEEEYCIEYTVDNTSTYALNGGGGSGAGAYKYGLPKIYSDASTYTFDGYEDIEITLLDGTTTTDVTTTCNNVAKVKIWYPANTVAVKYGSSSKIKTVDYCNTSNFTDMSSMFYQCYGLTSLDATNWDTSNVTNMMNMIYQCELLTSLDLSNWDTSNVTNMSQAFYSCYSLTSLDVSNWDTSNVTAMFQTFAWCANLTTLDLSNWDVSKVTGMGYMFSGCTELVDFIAPNNISVAVDFSPCTKLTHDSLMSIINNLATVTTTKTLTLGSTNLAKLTDAEKAIATNKGWTLA